MEQLGTCLQIGSGVTLQQLLVYMQSASETDADHGEIWKVFANTLSRIAGKSSLLVPALFSCVSVETVTPDLVLETVTPDLVYEIVTPDIKF